MGYRSVLDELLDKLFPIHATPSTNSTNSLCACWVLRQVAKSGEAILAAITLEKYSPERDDFNVLMVFETFSSNNRHKRAPSDLAEVHQVTALSPWNDVTKTFTAEDEPKARPV